MKILYSDKDFEKNYYYKKSVPLSSEYPKHYPCILDIVYVNGGIGGDFYRHDIVYFPKNVDKESFFLGYKRGVERVNI